MIPLPFPCLTTTVAPRANECCGTITGVAGHNGEWANIPPELDIISYDCYTVPCRDGTCGTPPGSVAIGAWNGTEEASMTRRYYEKWYHMLRPHQKLMVVPGLFGWCGR